MRTIAAMQSWMRTAVLIACMVSVVGDLDAQKTDQDRYLMAVSNAPDQPLFFREASRQVVIAHSPDREQPTRNELNYERIYGLELAKSTNENGLRAVLLVVRVQGSVTLTLGQKKAFDSLDLDSPDDIDKLSGLSTAIRQMIGQVGQRFRAKLAKMAKQPVRSYRIRTHPIRMTLARQPNAKNSAA